MNLTGLPVEVRYARRLLDTAGNEAHAATFIRARLIVLDSELLRHAARHRRILAHELFHFVWLRLGNGRRHAWEELLRSEWRVETRGEAGWSAEWRKSKMTPADLRLRTRRWREYCCESFCDTAACIFSGSRVEVTLAPICLAARRRWLAAQLPDPLPI